jgi:hypothetical protein
MNIAYKNYTIVQTQSLNYDLLRTGKRRVFEKVDGKRVNTGETRDHDEEWGYDMSLERCIEKIVKLELLEKQETVDLKTFLTEYNKAKQELLTEIKK